MSKVCVVVPTIREEQCKAFLEAWEETFRKVAYKVIIIEDNPRKSFKLPKKYALPIEHYSWKEINAELKKDAWIIPRRTDCIRSFGFLKAYNGGYDVLTLDDDTRPTQFYDTALKEARDKRSNGNVPYFNYGIRMSRVEKLNLDYNVDGYDEPLYMRGFPFKYRTHTAQKQMSIIYGGWHIVPDFDGITQIGLMGSQPSDVEFYDWNGITFVPKGIGLTGCIMNTYIAHEAIPLMYQLLMGKDHGYDRWGDIWSGLFAKRIMDLYDKPMGYGTFCVNHQRASNASKNVQKEASGYAINEVLWDKLLRFDVKGNTFADTYNNLAEFIELSNLFDNQEYSTKLAKAMRTWVVLCKRLN